jgi:lysine biosynthesis protein LysW
MKLRKEGFMTEVVTTLCPVCGELIEIVGGIPEKQVECSECGEVFRIVSLEPLKLAYAYDLEKESEFFEEDKPRR